MSDLIDRNDAVEAIEFEKVYMTAYKGSSNGYVSEGNPLKQYNKGLDDAIKAVNSLPSAEPERIIKIGQRSGKTLEFAINYLQSTGWLQEHDRILTESVEPDRKWVPVTEALPINDVDVIVSVLENSGDTPYRFTSVGWCTPDGQYWVVDNEMCYGVIAWMPLPEAWRGE